MASHMLCWVQIILTATKLCLLSSWQQFIHNKTQLCGIFLLYQISMISILSRGCVARHVLLFLETPETSGNEGKKDKSISLIPDFVHYAATLVHLLHVEQVWASLTLQPLTACFKILCKGIKCKWPLHSIPKICLTWEHSSVKFFFNMMHEPFGKLSSSWFLLPTCESNSKLLHSMK